MAAEELRGLVVLDVGILMGSRSPQVFAAQLAIYPGALRIYEAIERENCPCGDSLCSLKTFQTLITMDGEATREEAALFIAELDEKPTLTFENMKEYQHDFYTRKIAPRHSQSSGLAYLESLLGRQFTGRVVNGRLVSMVANEAMGLNPSSGDLGDDEPEHSGPPEERPDDPESDKV